MRRSAVVGIEEEGALSHAVWSVIWLHWLSFESQPTEPPRRLRARRWRAAAVAQAGPGAPCRRQRRIPHRCPRPRSAAVAGVRAVIESWLGLASHAKHVPRIRETLRQVRGGVHEIGAETRGLVVVEGKAAEPRRTGKDGPRRILRTRRAGTEAVAGALSRTRAATWCRRRLLIGLDVVTSSAVCSFFSGADTAARRTRRCRLRRRLQPILP